MRNIIQLKQAKAIEAGDYVLTPQHGTGILLAAEVVKVEFIDKRKRVELATDELRLHVVEAERLVAVII